MRTHWLIAAGVSVLALVGLVAGQGYSGDAPDFQIFDYPHNDRWQLSATQGRIGSFGTMHTVFGWDGSKRVIDATLSVDVDVETNKGQIRVKWVDTALDVTNHQDTAMTLPAPGEYMGMSGEFEIVFEQFTANKPTDPSQTDDFKEGGVADNVMLHGIQAPVFPLTRAYLGTWGPAKMYVNGTDMFPGVSTIGHSMYVPHIYREDQGWKAFKNCTEQERGDGSGALWSMLVGSADMADDEPNVNNQGCGGITDADRPGEFHINFRVAAWPETVVGMPGGLPFWVHIYFPDVKDNSAPVDSDINPLTPLEIAAIAVGGVVVLTLAVVFVKSRASSSESPREKLVNTA